jgi:hypothetical protein
MKNKIFNLFIPSIEDRGDGETVISVTHEVCRDGDRWAVRIVQSELTSFKDWPIADKRRLRRKAQKGRNSRPRRIKLQMTQKR